MPRYFTLEEANAALDVIRPLVGEILKIRQEILNQQPALWPVFEKAGRNGGSQAASQVTLEFRRMEALVHEIQATGALLKDVNTGLLDFPCLRDGHEVYLCWRYGEPRVLFWHEIEAGFAGRQPI